MKKKRIMFTYLHIGNGHVAPAAAVQGYLSERYPDEVETVMCDFFREINCRKVEKHFVRTWNRMIKFPPVVKLMHVIFRPLPHIVYLWMYFTLRPSYRSATRYLDATNPEIIFCTHAFVSFILQQVRRKYHHSFSLITLNTDPNASTVFLERLRHNDLLMVSSDTVARQMIRSGISGEKVIQFPFPIDRKFTRETDGQALLQEFGLNPQVRTLLVSFGGWGVGSVSEHIEALIKRGIKLNVIVVCGRNRELKAELEQQFPAPGSATVQVKVLGFVSNMHELLSASDFCFIKPGASSFMEAMIMQVPIIFYESLAHIEQANVDFAQQNRIGIYAGKNVAAFINAVLFFIHGNGLETAAHHYRQLQTDNGTEIIGDFLVSYPCRTDQPVRE